MPCKKYVIGIASNGKTVCREYSGIDHYPDLRAQRIFDGITFRNPLKHANIRCWVDAVKAILTYREDEP